MLCDIVDMNICYIFLDRCWKYDCKVIHGYVKNVINIEKGGRKHSLIPLQNEELGRRNQSIDS